MLKNISEEIQAKMAKDKADKKAEAEKRKKAKIDGTFASEMKERVANKKKEGQDAGSKPDQ